MISASASTDLELNPHLVSSLTDPSVVVEEKFEILPGLFNASGVGLDPMVGCRVEYGKLEQKNRN